MTFSSSPTTVSPNTQRENCVCSHCPREGRGAEVEGLFCINTHKSKSKGKEKKGASRFSPLPSSRRQVSSCSISPVADTLTFDKCFQEKKENVWAVPVDIPGGKKASFSFFFSFSLGRRLRRFHRPPIVLNGCTYRGRREEGDNPTSG